MDHAVAMEIAISHQGIVNALMDTLVKHVSVSIVFQVRSGPGSRPGCK